MDLYRRRVMTEGQLRPIDWITLEPQQILMHAGGPNNSHNDRKNDGPEAEAREPLNSIL